MQRSVPESGSEQPRFRYDAFISYAHDDEVTAAWLERVLERTWVPMVPRRSVFRDRTRLRSGPLGEELVSALRESRYLIVCCSDAALGSDWINREIDAFCHSRLDPSSHAVRSVLACQVGERATGTVPLPAALRWVQRELGDELYLADLRGQVAADSAPERRQRHREALSLLAPLIGLPDREAVAARIFKRRLAGLAALVLLAASGFAGWRWTRSDPYQVRQVVEDGQRAVVAAQAATVQDWVAALVEAGREELAVATARSISDPADRTVALSRVASALLARDSVRSRGLIDSALASAALIQDPSSYLEAVSTAVASGDGLMAAGTLDALSRARRRAMDIEHTGLRADGLASLGMAFATAHATDSVVAVARDIESIAAVADVEWIPDALGETARALHAVSNDAEARRFADLAIQAVRRIGAARRRFDRLIELARTFREAGLPDLSARALHLGADELPAVGSPMLQVFLARNLVAEWLVLGRSDSAQAVAALLARETGKVAEPDPRARALAYTAQSFAQLDSNAAAGKLALEALRTAERVTDPDRKLDVTTEVLGNVAHLGPRDTMRAALDRASRAAVAHSDDRGRSVALAHLAAAFVRLDDLYHARLLAERCPNSTDKLNAYRDILLHSLRGPNSAKPTTGQPDG